MTNLYNETIAAIERSGHTFRDIISIHGYALNYHIQSFFKAARNFEYNNEDNVFHVDSHLKILFKDGTFLERRMSLGMESWIYRIYDDVALAHLNYCSTDYLKEEYWSYENALKVPEEEVFLKKIWFKKDALV